MINQWLHRIRQSGYAKISLLGLLTASLIIGSQLIQNHGLFTLIGDFNYQQLPFNVLSNRAVKTGAVFWNWSTDLGSNFIGSYSFYTLGSPFFWLSLIAPATAFPYLIGPLLIIKYTVAGIAAYAFIKRYVKDENYAVVGGLLYAFSGFSTVSLVFNHFHDVIALFPLLLVALDRCVIENKKGAFALLVTFSALLNFFFFIGQVVFLALYYVIRYLMTDWKTYSRKLGTVLWEGALGVGLSCILFLPAVLFTMQNPRTQAFLYGPSGIVFNGKRVLEIMKAFLVPPELMFFQSSLYAQDFTSINAYLPLIGMTFVIGFLISKKNWISKLFISLMVMAFVPFLNSLFFATNGTYYARWFYMLVLIMALMSAVMFENQAEKSIKKGYALTGLFTALWVSALTLYPWNGETAIIRPNLFLLSCLIIIISLIVLYFLIWRFMHTRLWLPGLITSIILFSVSLTGLNIATVNLASPQFSSTAFYDMGVKTGQWIQNVLPSEPNYRIETSLDLTNLAMYADRPALNSFTSTINGSVFNFYESVGIDRTVETFIPKKDAALRALLSERFYVTLQKEKHVGTLYKTYNNGSNTVYVYQNAQTLPFGFAYTHYLTESAFKTVPVYERSRILLKALVIPDSEQASVAGILTPLDNASRHRLTDRDLTRDIENRKQKTATNFSITHKGFTADFKTDAPTYLYFSVPFDQGWTATVNGKPARIINSNHMMSLLVPAGANAIQFTYQTPGLHAGLALSLGSLIIFTGYIGVIVILRKRKKN